MEHKTATFEMMEKPSDEGRFEGYASVFGNLDQGLDIVMPGAFAKSLGGRKPKMLWQHDTREVIGAWEAVAEDAKGLYVKGRVFTDLPRGKEAMTLLREGEIDSMSIGYRTVEASEEGRARKLTEVELYEVSLVTFPMNEKAVVTAVKAARTEREFEQFLRDAGYSRKEAAAIALRGFKAKDGQRDAGSDDGVTGGLSALMTQLTRLKENING